MIEDRTFTLRLGHDRYWMRLAHAFVLSLWEVYLELHPTGYVAVAARDRRTNIYYEEVFEIQRAWGKLAMFLSKYHRFYYDLYFCPDAFATAKRDKNRALKTPYVWWKVRGGHWRSFNPRPNIAIRVAPADFDVLWIHDRAQTPGQAEAMSKHLANRFLGVHGNTLCTVLLRIPHTRNHEEFSQPPEIEVVWYDDVHRLEKVGPKPKKRRWSVL